MLLITSVFCLIGVGLLAEPSALGCSTSAAKAASAPPQVAPSPKVAARPKPFTSAVEQANAAIRRAKATDGTTGSAVVKTELDGEWWCDATITEIKTSDAGLKELRGETVVNRSIGPASVDSDSSVRAASSALATARTGAKKSLQDFERAWEPVKSGRSEYVRTKWGGCRRYWPRISDTEHQVRRSAIVGAGKQQIASAADVLETARARIRSEREQAARAARTVRLSVQAGQGLASLNELKVGDRVRLTFRVEQVDLATDPPIVASPAEHVALVRASMTLPAQVLSSARTAR